MVEIATVSHKIVHGGRTVFNSETAFLSVLRRFKSNRIKELELDFAADISVRKATKYINRIRLEERGVIPTTYRNLVEREGKSIQECIEQEVDDVLSQNGFDENGIILDNVVFEPERSTHIEQAAIENAAIKFKMWDYNASEYETPEESVNISIDDVCVKRQTENRPRP